MAALPATSGRQLLLEASTGTLCAKASNMGMPKPSLIDGKTYSAACL